jgi:hypothetical protein
MGSGSNPSSIKPDLFSTAQQPPETSSSSANDPKPPLRNDEPAAGASYALPTNLPSALRAFSVWAESNSPQEDSQKGGVERVFGV